MTVVQENALSNINDIQHRYLWLWKTLIAIILVMLVRCSLLSSPPPVALLFKTLLLFFGRAKKPDEINHSVEGENVLKANRPR